MSESLLAGDYQYVEYEMDSTLATANLGGSSVSSLNWPLFRLNREMQDVVAVKILAAEIPTSYFVFNTGNNQFTMQHVASFYTITIPPGNYTATTFPGVLKTLLDAASGGSWTISIDAATQKLSVAHNNGVWKFIFPDTSLRLYMGYNLGDSAVVLTNAASLAPNVINLSGPNFLYVNSNRIGPNCNSYLPQSNVFSGNVAPIITKIPITSNTGSVVYYTDPCPEKWFNLEHIFNLNSLDIYFTHPTTNQLIDFNGQGFGIKIGLLLKSNSKKEDVIQMNKAIKRIRPN